LKQLIIICDKLNINYYLIGGTLLGAVRHKGFIPWDDDIDVCLLRDDYNILVSEGQKYLNDKYFLQTYETDSEYPHCFAKLRNSNTTFIETSINNKNINHGIYIDIFPLDYYHSISFIDRIKYKLLHYQLFKKAINPKGLKKMIMLISNIVYGKRNSIELCRLKEKIIIKDKNVNKTKVTNFYGAWGIKKETHNMNCFNDYKIVKFENVDVKIPVGYNEILTNMYGDYMKLPPIENRVSHHYSDVIDTNKSYREYVTK